MHASTWEASTLHGERKGWLCAPRGVPSRAPTPHKPPGELPHEELRLLRPEPRRAAPGQPSSPLVADDIWRLLLRQGAGAFRGCSPTGPPPPRAARGTEPLLELRSWEEEHSEPGTAPGGSGPPAGHRHPLPGPERGPQRDLPSHKEPDARLTPSPERPRGEPAGGHGVLGASQRGGAAGRSGAAAAAAGLL